MKKSFLLAVASLILILPVSAQPKKSRAAAAPAPAPQFGNVEGITEAQLRDYLYFIASDEMEGRDTPSRGLDTTAKFIATMLARWGVQPAGDNGTYFQKIALTRDKLEPEKSSATVNGQSFKLGDDFLAQPVGGSVSGKVVYVGTGWVIKAKNLNAYKTDAGDIDVRDKIVVALSGLPKGITFRDVQGGKRGEDWMDPATYAAKNGARALIIVPTYQTLSNWQRSRSRIMQAGSLRVDKLGRDGGELGIPAINASIQMLDAIFQGEKESSMNIFNRAASGDPIPAFELSQKKDVSISIAVRTEQLTTQNVVAMLPGTDPVLKNEYVAIGAHYDHVGIGTPDAKGDAIFNGADDDGSGTTAVLGIAEAFAKGPKPKRSLLFVWHCGEEKGLWGSAYFTKFPTVNLNQVVTQLNIDMIGRSRKADDTDPRNKDLSTPDEVYVIGSKMMSSELGALSERVNNQFLKLSFNYKYDDPKDTNRFFFRSDHFNYAQKGVPIIFYFDGVHEDYHRQGDQPEKIDYRKMERVARTVLATAWDLGNQASRPKVDRQLPAELTSQ